MSNKRPSESITPEDLVRYNQALQDAIGDMQLIDQQITAGYFAFHKIIEKLREIGQPVTPQTVARWMSMTLEMFYVDNPGKFDKGPDQ